MRFTNKIIVILGQTSTGKSDYAVRIAKQINGEIISSDSRQVYKGMDLGTGKITKKEMRGIPHHLIDIINPKKVFSVTDYQKLSNNKIIEILNKNKIPIICGGTGFYIDAIVNGIVFPEVAPNTKLRISLSKKSTEELFIILKKIDKDRAQNIDLKNKLRIIRAIEIYRALGKIPKIKNINKYNVLKIGLTVPDKLLKERIRRRLNSRIKKGMIQEIENLHRKGLSWKRMYDLGLEYRNVSQYLQNKISYNEMVEKLNSKIWHFAKRQNTWFKRDKNIIWVDPRKKNDYKKVLNKIQNFLKK